MRASDIMRLNWVAKSVMAAESFFYRRSYTEPLVVAFAANETYLRPLGVTLTSLLHFNSCPIKAYILSMDLSERAQETLRRLETHYPQLEMTFLTVEEERLASLQLSNRKDTAHISRETFFRYFLPELLPQHDKVLYLDVDLVVCGSLKTLWQTDLTHGALCAGVEDSWTRDTGHNAKLGFAENALYVNAGVILMNLQAMRAEGIGEKLIRATLENDYAYMDQDAINCVCRGRIIKLANRFNVTSDMLRRKAIRFRGHPTIVHYTGWCKPWMTWDAKQAWRYRVMERKWERLVGLEPRIKVGILVNEFFGGAGTAYGGYGFLTRYGLCKYVKSGDIQLDVILLRGKNKKHATCEWVDGTLVYHPPRRSRYYRRWLKAQAYDCYISIELVDDSVLRCERNPRKRLLFWIQDPRPQRDWEEIETVKLFPEPSYWHQRIYDSVHAWAQAGRVRFLTQATSLNPKAAELYQLDPTTPIQTVPNPLPLPYPAEVVKAHPKADKIVFLGRVESVKRGWLFAEIAKQMPDLQFHIIGASTRDKLRNETLMAPYMDLPNLHFEGHLEGLAKYQLLLDAKILVNTSIHEAVPISFLEALACGTLLVSNQPSDGLTARFGEDIGPLLGDGFDGVDRYVTAIRKILADEPRRCTLAAEAVDYVATVHTPERFREDFRALIEEEAARFRHRR